jgi:two-component system response regulator RegA
MQTLIVIDDDPIFLKILKRRLEQTNLFTVHVFTSIAAALTFPTITIDGILLDMMLGDDSGLDGIIPLKSHFNPKHLIMLTGYASIATTVEAMRRGATDYVAKPAGLQELIQRFRDDLPLPKVHYAKPMTTAQVEWEHIPRVLLSHSGNISATAQALGMHRRSLQRKLQKYSPSKN